MQVLHLLAIQVLMVSLFACKRAGPEFAPIKQPAPPVEVVVSIKPSSHGLYVNWKTTPLSNAGLSYYEWLEKKLAGSLRDSLSDFVAVVPESATAPPDALQLEVRVYRCYELPINSRMQLGYDAPFFSGVLLLHDPQKNKTVHLGNIPTNKIARELKPLDDSLRIYVNGKNGKKPHDSELEQKSWVEQTNREISRAFAETITKQLQKKFCWQTKG